MDVKVSIVMGSQSDWAIMEHTTIMLDTLKISYEVKVISAHRAPDTLMQYVQQLKSHGTQVIIAAAGMAAHLAGVIAGKTTLPVLGVPMPGGHLQGMDALLSMVQMPKGVPVATFAVGKAGAINAAICAASIIALSESQIDKRLTAFRAQQTQDVTDQQDIFNPSKRKETNTVSD